MDADSAYLRACGQSGIIIDTNLLILLLVGRYKSDYISKCPKTSGFTVGNYQFIENLLQATSAKVIVTPQILAELSNHTFDKMLYGVELKKYLINAMAYVHEAKESHVPKEDYMHDILLPQLGFTDVSILEAAKRYGYAVLTEDGKLFSSLYQSRCPTMNLVGGDTLQLA